MASSLEQRVDAKHGMLIVVDMLDYCATLVDDSIATTYGKQAHHEAVALVAQHCGDWRGQTTSITLASKIAGNASIEMRYELFKE